MTAAEISAAVSAALAAEAPIDPLDPTRQTRATVVWLESSVDGPLRREWEGRWWEVAPAGFTINSRNRLGEEDEPTLIRWVDVAMVLATRQRVMWVRPLTVNP